MGCVDDRPEIVKILSKEEEMGLLQNNIQKNFQQLQTVENDTEYNSTKSSVSFEDDSLDEFKISSSGEETDLKQDIPKEELKKELTKLRKKYNELREKLKKNEEKYRSLSEYFETISETTIALGKKDLFSDVSDIVFQISQNGKITYINSSIEKIAGYISTNLIGDNFSDLLPKKDWKKLRKDFSRIVSKKESENVEIEGFETYIIHKDGHSIPVEINGKIVEFEFEAIGKKGKIQMQGSIRDITERKKAEEERIRYAEHLRSMNEELNATNEELITTQDELENLNRNLEEKVTERTAEIERLLKHKDEFIGQLSHDLKSPLTPLVGLLPYLEENEKDPKLKEMLSIANRNVTFMKDLVVKTLQFERLSLPNMKLDFEDVYLHEIVNQIITNKKFILNEKDVAVKNNIKEKFVICADKLRFKELLDNLVTNAVKFIPTGGVIIIDVKKEKSFALLSIKDTGVGLTAEQIDHIFDEFYKVDPARHDLDSSGLGLPICKRIVEKHNGTIWAESSGLKAGTIFYVKVPLNQNRYRDENI